MDASLMPSVDSSPPCSAFTKSIAVRPAGSGLCLERVVLASLPEPWPKPALGHQTLKPAAAALAQSAIMSRLFAAAPWTDVPTLEVYERQPGRGVFERFSWAYRDAHELSEVVGSVAQRPIGALATIEGSSGPPTCTSVIEPTMLLCTQGSHDMCCGRLGNELADTIAAVRPGVVLRRVSHTGGHRFAPTLIALPSGRMWAWADLGLIDRIASNAETSADLAAKCRGSLATQKGPAQVAEVAARIHWGVEPPETVTVAAGSSNSWTVRTSNHEVDVQVRPGREIPTIACESPGGQPIKVTTDYQWKIGDGPWI